MNKSCVRLGLVLLVILPTTAAAAQGIWEIIVTAEMQCGNDLDVTMFCIPDGSGPTFAQAMTADGLVVDARILVHIYDGLGVPIVSFPAEDIWLESIDGQLVPCVGGIAADMNTDDEGATWFAEAPLAGGHSEADCELLVGGVSFMTDDLPIHFNSADLNGDLAVNLADVGMFVTHLFGTYDVSADLWRDGVLNLADVGRLAQGLGATCP